MAVKKKTLTTKFMYKKCPWYMENIDRCKMPSCIDKFLKCKSKEQGKMQEFCLWLIDFLTIDKKLTASKPIQLELFDIDNYTCDFGNPSDLAPISYMEDLFERAYDSICKRNENKDS